MITGSITLNNLSDAQIAAVLEAESKHPDKLAVRVPSIQQYAGASPLVSGVVLSWNNDEGYMLAVGVVGQFIQAPQSTEKAQ